MWLIPLADETQGVQVKLCYPMAMRAIPERLRDVSCIDAIQIDITFPITFYTFLGAVLANKLFSALTKQY